MKQTMIFKKDTTKRMQVAKKFIFVQLYLCNPLSFNSLPKQLFFNIKRNKIVDEASVKVDLFTKHFNTFVNLLQIEVLFRNKNLFGMSDPLQVRKYRLYFYKRKVVQICNGLKEILQKLILIKVNAEFAIYQLVEDQFYLILEC